MNNISLNTKRLKIRPISKNDLENIHYLHCLPETNRLNTLGIPKDILETKVIDEQWIDENNFQNNKRYTFVIEVIENNKFIGLIGMNLDKEKNKNAEVWFKLDSEFWNKGYATESLKEIINFGFKNLKLHRIEASCAVENIGSVKILENVGMKREVHKRQLLPFNSGWSEKYGYAILSTD